MSTPIHSAEMPSSSSTAEHVTSGISANGASTATTSNESQINGTGVSARTKSEAEIAADKLYEERIEEEYAKREGGA